MSGMVKSCDSGFSGYPGNGRVYDPLIGQFLSPDNYVQVPDFTQNFNRYSYCLNNPLKYTDPSEEWFFTALFGVICTPLAPLGVMLDASAWSATIDLGIQGLQMLSGSRDQINWSQVGGAAVGGFIFGGMGLIAPSFSVTSTSFMTNLPKYAGKAGWAALTGAVSTGAGMFASDMFDNGQIDYSAEDYLKAMGTAGLISRGFSFWNSIYEYASWDRFTSTEKLDIMKFGSEYTKIKFDANLEEYGSTVINGNYSEITFGSKAFENRRLAIATGRHEMAHITNTWRGTSWSNKMIVKKGFRGDRFDWLTEFHAKRVGMRTWGVDMNYWLERYSLVNSNPWNVKFFWPSFGIDQLLSLF